MKRSSSAFRARASGACCLLAAVAGFSALLSGDSRLAAQRPRPGGTLRLELPAAIRLLDPASAPADDAEAAAKSAVLPLVFETLVRADGPDGLEPGLAESWEADAPQKQWQFRLRRGVRLHDGTVLTPAHVASVLHAFDDAWVVRETPDGVRIESPQPLPDLPWDLADPQRAIALPGTGAWPLGTGPFRVDRWDAGRRLVLAAHDGYRAGRPFVDAVQIDFGRPPRDEVLDLEVGRADIVSVPVQDARRLAPRGVRVISTRPGELVALVFDAHRPAGGNDQVRRALGLAVDRSAICNVLLQRQAEPAAGLLPGWLSGYADLFDGRYDRAAARAIAQSLPLAARTLSLDFPAGDPLAQAIAERVAVDARDAGLAVNVAAVSSGVSRPADVRLVRAGLSVTTPERALGALVASLALDARGLPPPGAPLDSVYQFEQSLLARDLAIPLVHLPQLYGVGPRVAFFAGGPLARPSGSLNLADAWLRPEGR